MFMSSLQHILLTFYWFCAGGNDYTPITITTTPSHHHPPSPYGFKHPNQLKERRVHCGPPPTSVREGKQEGPHSWAIQGNNITPSVTNRFISDGMKYSSQIHLPLYHLCVLAYSCPSLYQFPEAYAVALCVRLPSSHQPALSNHLASYAF